FDKVGSARFGGKREIRRDFQALCLRRNSLGDCCIFGLFFIRVKLFPGSGVGASDILFSQSNHKHRVVPTRNAPRRNVSYSLWLMIATKLHRGLKPLLFLLLEWELGFYRRRRLCRKSCCRW